MTRVALVLLLACLLPGCGENDGGADRPSGTAPSVATITADALAARLGAPDPPLVLDVRTEAEYRTGHVPGAVLVPYTEVASRLAELAPNRERDVVVYCERGPRARTAEKVLLRNGFRKVYHLVGDMAAYRRSGYPVAR